MRPSFPPYNKADISAIDSKLIRYSLMCVSVFCQLSDLPNLMFGQFTQAFKLFTSKLPALTDFVVHVFPVSSKKEMIGSYARRVIATVKHTKMIGYLPIRHFIGSAMGTASLKFTIPIFVGSGSPSPAVIGLGHMLPKLEGVSPRAIAAAPFSGICSTFSNLKNLSARFACDLKTIPTTTVAAPSPRLGHIGLNEKLGVARFACYFNSSHDLNLRDRFELWSGSLAAQTVCGPLCILPQRGCA